MDVPASLGPDEGIRLFCALRLPDDTLDRLVRWQGEAPAGARDARVLERDHLHITLAFLGYRPGREVEAISQALRQAAAGGGRPTLTVSRYRETHSVGMLVLEDKGGLAASLALDLHERLERLGVYRREARLWLPHVTVVRFRQGARGRHPRRRSVLPDLGAFSPSGASLYHSVLRSGGAQYEVLETVALGG